MEADYHHKQFGTATVILLLVVGLLLTPFLASLFADGKVVSALITIALFFLILLMFYAITIEISDGQLKFWLGIGLIRKSYPLTEIESAETVVSPWYYLWGIKTIPGGWYYAVSPGSAVEIVLKNQKVLRLGTNQPEELEQAITGGLVAS